MSGPASQGIPGSGAGTYSPLTSTEPAAIAIIRVAGPAFEAFGRKHLEFTAGFVLNRLHAGDVRRAVLLDSDQAPIDDIVVSVRSGHKQWDVWLHLHGGPWLTRRCCELLDASGLTRTDRHAVSAFQPRDAIDAAIAERLPEMLTLAGVHWLTGQAALLPRLVQRLAAAADAHPQLVRRACARLADSLRVFGWFTQPPRIALIGPPNAGKSTLFNRLVGDAISITSPHPGTTRDWVEAPAELGGFPVTWIDTAGIFLATDPLDAAGVAAARTAHLTADIRVAVFDATDAAIPDSADADIFVLNKVDSAADAQIDELRARMRKLAPICSISAINGDGLDGFRSMFLRLARRHPRVTTRPAVFTPAQAGNATSASRCLDRKSLKNMILRIVS